MATIDSNTYADWRAKINAFEAWRQTLGRNWHKPDEVPEHLRGVTNDMRSAVERYEFHHNPPRNYFLYVNEKAGLATTWTGESLGSVQIGHAYNGGFRDKRKPVTVHAVNGHVYVGTYYCSAGDYARVRMKMRKGKPVMWR